MKINDIKNKIKELKDKKYNVFMQKKQVLNKIIHYFNKEYISSINIHYDMWDSVIVIGIQLKCAWTSTVELAVKDKETYKFRTSSGGINNEKDYLIEMHKITGDFIKFINEFDIDGIKKEIENYEDEIYNCNKEFDKLNQELNKLNLMKNFKKADIKELTKKAKDGEVVQFFTLRKSTLKHTLKYENNRFKVNNRVIAKSKLAEKYPEIYVAKK
jgi:hypothetical protein